MITLIREALPLVSIAPACRALGFSRASVYRWMADVPVTAAPVAAAPVAAAPVAAAPVAAAIDAQESQSSTGQPAFSSGSSSSGSSSSGSSSSGSSSSGSSSSGVSKETAAKPSGCRVPGRALQEQERQQVLGLLHSDRFMNYSPAQVYATLLDEGSYHCSISTMYRLLRKQGEVKERRDQLRHPEYSRPELLATRVNELWSWDITRLLGPQKWTYYYLYVIMDVFSRYVVGWMVAHREDASLAEQLIRETSLKQQIQPGQLTIHADRGSSMTSKPVAFLLADLGITKTHSRPHVSNDNPYSESQFKTMKYRPDFPRRFTDILTARSFCTGFFPWYNKEHHHSGLALLTPEMVHYGQSQAVIAQRQQVLSIAYQLHPQRFIHQPPQHPAAPMAAWINKPETSPETAPSTTYASSDTNGHS